MPMIVILVDFFGLVLVYIGFTMAFRQQRVRRLWRQWQGNKAIPLRTLPDGKDPVTYALRIFGTMIMIFGFTLGMMMTLFHLG